MSCVTSGPFGLFPDCDNLGGSVFLTAVYGFALLTSAKLIADGSELLLEVFSPGVVGGLLLPILGSVPDAAVIVASGIGASKEIAQHEVAVGMGTLAGSVVMLLTVTFAGSLWVGRCDLDDATGQMIPKTLTRGAFEFVGTGVSVDKETRLNARIMIASCACYLVLIVPAFFGDVKDAELDAVAAGVALASALAY